MDYIPTEIWTEIFSHACTDSGFTGCSLALVSRFFRAASEHVKLQSVALSGPRKIIAFESMLCALPAHLRRVRFIYLSDRLPSGSWQVAERAIWDQRGIMGLKDAMGAAMRRILELVAESVEIMELCIPSEKFNAITLIPFPRLADLTGNFYPFQHLHDHYASPFPSLYPRLRRWHLTKPLHLYHREDMFDSISQLAPSLELLRISAIAGESSLPRALASALGLNYEGYYSRSSAQPCLRAVKIYAKMMSPSQGGKSYTKVMKDFEDMNMLGNAGFALLKAQTIAEDRGVGRETVDWEAAINGEEGCWSLHDQVPPGKEETGEGSMYLGLTR